MTKVPDHNSAGNQQNARPRPALRLVTHYDAERSVPGPTEPPRRQGESRRIFEKRIAEESRRAAINPELHPNDPRWILAAQTIQALQGPALNPSKRAKLLRKATHLGIRPFDANLVIAIVQDQARQNISGTNNTPADTFKFKHTDLADRLQIIPHVGVPSIRNLPPLPPPASPASPTSPTATSDTAAESEAVRYRVNPFLRLAILLTVTLALTAGLFSLLVSWLFNTAS